MRDSSIDEERNVYANDGESAPVILRDSEGPFVVDWIAQGSDGNLYVAPAVPGGWLQRKRYEGSPEDLAPISPEKARTIAWYLYGDVGDVTIADE